MFARGVALSNPPIAATPLSARGEATSIYYLNIEYHIIMSADSKNKSNFQLQKYSKIEIVGRNTSYDQTKAVHINIHKSSI